MSVRIWATVWTSSRHSGSELLMLLALADFADDEGLAYPSIATLARKCRMSTRNVNLILAQLRKGGELEVRQNAGPNGANVYRIRMPAPLKNSSPPPPEELFTPEEGFTLKPASSPPEAGFPIPLKPASPKPSVNRQQPSDMANKPLVSSRAADPCPHQAIIDLYHQTIPTGRRVRQWTEARRAKLRARWKEEPNRQCLEWWKEFFAYIGRSDFLTGRTYTPGRKPFELDLEWIVTPGNFVKIIEGKYQNQEAAA